MLLIYYLHLCRFLLLFLLVDYEYRFFRELSGGLNVLDFNTAVYVFLEVTVFSGPYLLI
jgi:hypothetical protein